jgi:hypothetical protein
MPRDVELYFVDILSRIPRELVDQIGQIWALAQEVQAGLSESHDTALDWMQIELEKGSTMHSLLEELLVKLCVDLVIQDLS